MKLVPKKYKGHGLHNYCNACKRQITSKCGKTNASLKNCQDKDKWRYKIVLHVPQPSGPGKKKTKTCEKGTTLDEALKKLYEFKGDKPVRSKNRGRSDRKLKEGVEVFLRKKFCEGEFKNQSKTLSKQHLQDIVRVIERFLQSLRNTGINPDTMCMSDLDDNVLAPFYNHIEDFVSSSTAIDRHTRIMRNFLNFLTDRGMYKGANFFKTIDVKSISGSPVAVTDEEFAEVLSVISQENGVGIKGTNRKKDYYRPWLPHMFRLARLTGLRTEELYNLRWSDIYSHQRDNYRFEVLVVHNLKVERLKNRDDIIKAIPVTTPLSKLLDDIKKEGCTSEKVIDTGFTKGAFSDFIGRAFTHFYKVAFPGEKHKVFKQLRKTQLTDIYGLLGEDAYKLTDHSGNQILEKHYVDKVQAAIKLLELEQKANG